MTTPREVYKKMLTAYAKCSEASDEWNELNKLIIERERIYCEHIGLDPVTLGDRLSDVKDKARTLKDVFNKYSFWKGEVERHATLLSGLLAFEQLQEKYSD